MEHLELLEHFGKSFGLFFSKIFEKMNFHDFLPDCFLANFKCILEQNGLKSDKKSLKNGIFKLL